MNILNTVNQLLNIIMVIIFLVIIMPLVFIMYGISILIGNEGYYSNYDI
jgi:hypothetical protein